MTSRRRWVLAAAGAMAGIALGLRAGAAWNPGVDPRLVVWDLAVGWSFIGGGLAAWAARPSSAAGRLLVVVGVAWFAGSIWPSLEFLHLGPLFHVLATYPTGRLTVRGAGAGGWLRVVAVVAVYAASVTRLSGEQLVVAAVAAGFLVLGATGVLRTRGAMRRARLTSSAAAIAVALALIAPSIGRVTGASLGITPLLAYDAVLAVCAIGLSVDLIAGRWSQGLLTSAVVDLGDAAHAGSVRERLVRSLGDPSLMVAYAVDDPPDSFVDELGQPVALPPASPGSGRHVDGRRRPADGVHRTRPGRSRRPAACRDAVGRGGAGDLELHDAGGGPGACRRGRSRRASASSMLRMTSVVVSSGGSRQEPPRASSGSPPYWRKCSLPATTEMDRWNDSAMTSSAPGQTSPTSQEVSIRPSSRVRAYRRRSSTWSTGRPIRSTWSPTRDRQTR